METASNIFIGVAVLLAVLVGIGIWIELRRVTSLADRNERRLSGRAED